jgi:hypothetical protein
MDGIPMVTLEGHLTEEEWKVLEALSGLPLQARVLIQDAVDLYMIRIGTGKGLAPTALRERVARIGAQTKQLMAEMNVFSTYEGFPAFARTGTEEDLIDRNQNANNFLQALHAQLKEFHSRLETIGDSVSPGKPGPKGQPLTELLNALNTIVVYYMGKRLNRAKRDKKTGIGLCDFAIQVCRAADPTITPSTVMNVIKDKLDVVDRLAIMLLEGMSIAAHAAKGTLLTGRISEWRHYDVVRGDIYPIHWLDGVPLKDLPGKLAELDEERARAEGEET